MASEKSQRSLVRTVFQELIWPYWIRSESRWHAWSLLGLIFLLMIGMVYSLVLLNRWNQEFYDALQTLNQEEFFRQLLRFFYIALIYSLIMAYKFYVLQKLAVNWREWITKSNLSVWLQDKNYYFWQVTKNTQDNPDQRLSEDIHELTDLSLEISEKILREAITLVSFIGILWGLSGSLKFDNIFGYRIEIHHYLVWFCLLYAVAGTYLTHKIGHPLSRLNFLQQKLEADFRYFLVRLRENSESVALLHGEKVEKQKILDKFSAVVINFKELIFRQKKLILTTNVYGQLAYIFPFVVASPRLFTKEITLGQLFQISSAFGQVQGSVSVFVNLYAQIARWHSVVVRLGGFLNSIEEFQRLRQARLLPHVKNSRGQIHEFENLKIQTPQGKTLIPQFNLRLNPGDRVLITAPSGKGKSTLLRGMNGIWPYIEGQIRAPSDSRRLILSQKPYLPFGTLRLALAYPHLVSDFEDTDFSAALAKVGLTDLTPSLDAEENWAQRLSSGEQQRLALARIFLQKPSLVYLDEATSALEKTFEAQFYRALTESFPEMIIVSFSHDTSSLEDFHQKTLSL